MFVPLLILYYANYFCILFRMYKIDHRYFIFTCLLNRCDEMFNELTNQSIMQLQMYYATLALQNSDISTY
jgi:hypothetical protein